jgi:hypothetical protein
VDVEPPDLAASELVVEEVPIPELEDVPEDIVVPEDTVDAAPELPC